MRNELVTRNLPEVLHFDHIPEKEMKDFGKKVISLMNLAGVNTGRATHYNTKEEKEEMEKKVHHEIFSKDRGVYAAVHCMPGVTDYSIQRATMAMLGNTWEQHNKSALTQDVETFILKKLVANLPANRMLNLFSDIRENRINNSRAKKRIILETLLNAKGIDWWAVKYRNKMRKALEHALGKRRTGILKSILSQDRMTADGFAIVKDFILQYVDLAERHVLVLDSLRFILGCPIGESESKLFKAFNDAKKDLKKGKGLPMEVLEGIRSTYHKEVPQEAILELTKKTMTNKQKRQVQKKAQKAGVEVKFDPMKSNTVDLYIYAFEMGMTDAVAKALKVKAEKIAASFPYSFKRLGILVDDSHSMSGHDTQKLRPMAITFAIRDVLRKTADKCDIEYATGTKLNFHKPRGGTDLATGLVNLAMKDPDAIFIISDGYENQPSGRVNEILMAFERVGFKRPIYQINPVVASETGKGLRSLSESMIVIPASKPESLVSNMLIPMLETDPVRALSNIVNSAIKLIGQGDRAVKRFSEEEML